VVSDALRRGRSFVVEIDGDAVDAFSGETIAALMLRLGRRALRVTLHGREPRGYFCGMGSCFDCVVSVDGVERSACVTVVRNGMRIATDGART
jgi:predicted molibdopterin-dependent oxidoreductase YjgC